VQYRLGLIVGRVTGGDPPGPGVNGDLRQPLVPHRAGRRFQVPAELFNCKSFHVETFTKPIRQLTNEVGVGVALVAAQLVVQVSDHQPARRVGLVQRAE